MIATVTESRTIKIPTMTTTAFRMSMIRVRQENAIHRRHARTIPVGAIPAVMIAVAEETRVVGVPIRAATTMTHVVEIPIPVAIRIPEYLLDSGG